MKCPACGSETNSAGEQLHSCKAVALHIAGKILGVDMNHRVWIRKTARDFEVTGWSQRGLTWGNMNELAKLIYPEVERAIDEAYITASLDPSTLPNAETVTANHVAEMARQLNQIINAVDPEGRLDGEGVVARIVRLKRNGMLPRNVAELMCAIREYRNTGEHDTVGFSDADIEAITGAWKVISSWASSQGIIHLDVLNSVEVGSEMAPR